MTCDDLQYSLVAVLVASCAAPQVAIERGEQRREVPYSACAMSPAYYLADGRPAIAVHRVSGQRLLSSIYKTCQAKVEAERAQ